jgi:predicted dehydrogenase
MKYQRELTFAIVGCGLIGRRRMWTLPPGSLKYACDLDRERAKQLAGAMTNCTNTTDLETVLGDFEIDAKFVAVANAALASITLRAVKAGKHVLGEKPGAIISTQLAEIESAAAAAGAMVRIGYNHRFPPGSGRRMNWYSGKISVK